jgi:hypothetical protein
MAFGMMPLALDWRSLGRWNVYGALRGLLAGDDGLTLPSLPRYVQRWLCQRCERSYLGTDPAPQYCPGCDRPLTFIAQWDLMRERAPRWWADPGTRGTP